MGKGAQKIKILSFSSSFRQIFIGKGILIRDGNYLKGHLRTTFSRVLRTFKIYYPNLK